MKALTPGPLGMVGPKTLSPDEQTVTHRSFISNLAMGQARDFSGGKLLINRFITS
jgi:hypothetical protein